MKSRPRRAENGIAKALSEWFASYGLSPVERKPVIGRTGPDLTINELGLVVDAKSRIKVPKLAVIDMPEVIQIGSDFFGVRIKDLDLLFSEFTARPVPTSEIITRWWDHMNEWRVAHAPNGVTALVLHKPVETKDGKRTARQPYYDATFVIQVEDREVLDERITEWKNRRRSVHSGVGGQAQATGSRELPGSTEWSLHRT